ncbi:hypothetical protein Pcinc_019215 [Petrolisthes cinctipes]|uniref:Uncharacterized protein n=1 Tax=Petrolisthes cinctipes TaxID=88211 RepID=A0AAE1FKR0_PETCI|nr:hypothetical protein Pcinc_019215 [Petrolisthes cinctipes]
MPGAAPVTRDTPGCRSPLLPQMEVLECKLLLFGSGPGACSNQCCKWTACSARNDLEFGCWVRDEKEGHLASVADRLRESVRGVLSPRCEA